MSADPVTPERAPPPVVVRGVSKRYAGATALHPTTLELAAGVTTAVIGPSGSGKSTLLRILVGLVRPDSGSVAIGEAQVGGPGLLGLRRRMGYVTQGGGLFPHLTARENVTLVARHLAWPRGRVEARVRELADLTRLGARLLERYPAQLSGGERQRVSLVRALVLDPDVLLLDEPLGALDPLIRFDLQSDLRRIFRTLGKTVVLVTHDLGEAAFLGDELVLMSQGRVVQRGPLRVFLDQPAEPFVRRFFAARRELGEAPP